MDARIARLTNMAPQFIHQKENRSSCHVRFWHFVRILSSTEQHPTGRSVLMVEQVDSGQHHSLAELKEFCANNKSYM